MAAAEPQCSINPEREGLEVRRQVPAEALLTGTLTQGPFLPNLERRDSYWPAVLNGTEEGR